MQEKFTNDIENLIGQEKRDALSKPFFEEVDEQISELDMNDMAKNPFSKELVNKAYGILKFKLPQLDSFIIKHEGGGKNSWRLANKRRELYLKLEAIFEMEKERRVTNMEAEIEQGKQEAVERKIKIVPYESYRESA